MFRDSLLESALGARRRKRWPMLLAVALEVIIGGALLAIPLFSTGIIPVDAKTIIVAPRLDHPVRVADPPDAGHRGTGQPSSNTAQPALLTFNQGTPVIGRGRTDPTGEPGDGFDLRIGGGGQPACTVCIEPAKPKPTRGVVRVSHMYEGQLLYRVEPVYPHIMTFTQKGGEVKLHAIIAKDGSIQSLSVISGHPLFASAALEAVRQWRYRPYLLNGEAVEVETLITVNFRNDR